ncbi:hypothetical protein KIN20_013866 [Parelaphostrongylus tenuis]|uniref:SCP domain-containing protein n=1 Tax=Parelaphostrongylus tenuis TaxID=148309 RepID=A0AAD5MG79_PARTN|nr:hypothetical protein KIN20_013866 [Parelaphostrongylus tenuis]
MVRKSEHFQSGLCNGGYTKPFGCQGQAINDQTRDDVLSFFNLIRARLAQGHYEKFGLSSASHMNKLRWDCDLESIAEIAVRYCRIDKPSLRVVNAINFN